MFWRRKKEQSKERLERAVYEAEGLLSGLISSTLSLQPTYLQQEIQDKEGEPIHKVFMRMLADAHITAVLNSRKSGVLSRKWQVIGPRAEFVTRAIEYIDGLQSGLSELLNAVATGYAVVEIVWERVDGYWWPSKLIPRPYWHFRRDGDRWIYEPRSEEVPSYKAIIHVNRPTSIAPEGTPLLLYAYYPWAIKRNAVKAWSLFVHRFALPTAIGKYENLSEKDRRALLDALLNLQEVGAAVVPKEAEVELIQASSGNAAAIERLVNWANKEISKIFLGQTLTTELGHVGTYAAAKVHMDVREEIVIADAEALSDTLNATLITWIIELNYGPQKEYPYFVFDTSRRVSVKEMIEFLKAGGSISKKFFYEKTGWLAPENAEDELTLGGVKLFAEEEGDVIKFGEEKRKVKERVFARGNWLNKLYESGLKELIKVYEGMIRKIKTLVDAAEDYTGVSNIKLNDTDLDRIADVLLRVCLMGYLKGRADVVEDVAKGLKQFEELRPEPLMPERALAAFRNKVVIDPDRYYELPERLRTFYFTVSRVEGERILRRLKEAVERAIAEGKTFLEFKDEVNSIFDRAGLTRLNPYHLETVLRTNLQTAYHAGWIHQIKEPQFEGFVPYVEYSAILDERTRPSHAALNGKIARLSEFEERGLVPPNGYNCRCTLIPITRPEVQRHNIRPTGIPNWIKPDPGFENNPAELLEV